MECVGVQYSWFVKIGYIILMTSLYVVEIRAAGRLKISIAINLAIKNFNLS